MELFIYIITGILTGIAITGLVVWFLLRAKKPKEADGGFLLIQNQIDNLTRAIESKLGESGKEMRETMFRQSSENQRIIKDITEKLTRVDEGQKQVVSFADQLGKLEDILKNPKQRGVLGEYYLETLLKNILPGSYEMQYHLGKNDNGEDLIPDAVVFVQKKIIPIDSKFSLENYNRLVEERNITEKDRLEKLFVNDLKNRIVETSKYIQPNKGTMDFAFMFIPHEAIYYDLLTNRIGSLKEDGENLIRRAASKYKVIIVSPTSFLAYLQTVLQGLNALKIESEVQDIIKRVGDLVKHLSSYDNYFRKVGNALSTTVGQYNMAYKELKKVDKDILKITDKSADIEPLELDKPKVEED